MISGGQWKATTSPSPLPPKHLIGRVESVMGSPVGSVNVVGPTGKSDVDRRKKGVGK